MSRSHWPRSMPWVAAVMAAAGLVLAMGAVQADGSAQRTAWKANYHRPTTIPFPDENPYSKAKDDLGRMLFFDPILSGSGARSCASCHNPSIGWTDGLAKAHGDGEAPLALHTPTTLNMAWSVILGWEGKFRNLEAVAFEGPITARGNMNRKEEDLIAALSANSGYRRAFAEAFNSDGTPTRRDIEDALATFERTVVSGRAPFDRWIEGDETAIGEAAKRGFDLFNGKAQCAECHGGWNFTDGSFHDIGTATGDDVGRARLFPNSVKLRYAFKVPTLRDVVRRAPYMHNGSEATLESTVELYDRGGIDRPSRSELIKPLGLSAQEKADLIAFLGTLNGESQAFVIPALPR